MALTEARKKANDKYIKENYQRLPVSYPKEFCQMVREAAEANGESLAGFVRKAIEDRINRNGMHLVDGTPPAIQAYLDEIEKCKQETFEQRKAIIDATSYVSNDCDKDNPVWKDRTKSEKTGE